MSLLHKALSLFSKNKPGEPTTLVLPQETTSQPELGENTQSKDVIYIYSHGFTNGVYKIEPDKDSFVRFLEYCNHSDRIKEQRELTEKAISDIELKLQAASSSYLADTHTSIEKGKQAENISLTLTELERLRNKNEEKETTLTAQIKESIAEYSWAPALLYLFAGITFIVADVSITKQITSWGFDMSGLESWIFAIGLAFTAFLIKPAIDRLLEKPFQVAGFKLKTLYKCVLLGLTAIGLIMLCLLGKFRSDSKIAQKEIESINAQIRPLDPISQAQKYNKLLEKREEIQKSLDQNKWGQYGLILSGVLFAMGGAICLSISFGSLKQLINRYWILPVRLHRLKKEIKRATRQNTSIRSEYTALITEQEKAENMLSSNESTQLKEALIKLQEERAVLNAEFHQVQFEKERALYLDGRNKGDKYTIEGDLSYNISGNDQSSINLGKKSMPTETSESPTIRPYTRRPFIKMRKMIADNFNKNQNTPSYDGTEFEIVS
jgi:hypothetical protein